MAEQRAEQKKAKGKVEQAEVERILENVCNPRTKEGKWVAKLDIVNRDRKLELVPQETVGKCQRECETVAHGCTELLEKAEKVDKSNELSVILWQGTHNKVQLMQALCKQWTGVCPYRNYKPVQREVDEDIWNKIKKVDPDDPMNKIPGMNGMMDFDRGNLDDLPRHAQRMRDKIRDRASRTREL